MDPEIKTLLVEVKALVKDNHDMLRLIRREAWTAYIVKVIFWVVIVIAPIFFLLPYLGSLPTPAQMQDVLKAYQGQI
jgi:hypothetical protein